MIGQHLLADLYDVASDRLVDAGLLAGCLDDAARRGGMKPIGPPVLHRFQGGGLTGYLLLSESHIAFHSYPEYRYIALDIFSCGRADSNAALSVFVAALDPGHKHLSTAPRGAEIPQRDREPLNRIAPG
jgi:S-adenosylmethionine decarboxylase